MVRPDSEICMRVLVTALFMILLSGAVVQSQPDRSPNWSLQTADGQTIELAAAVKQKPQIVFLWATWCPYCKALMPHLQSIVYEYGDDVDVLAVNIFDDGDPATFIENAGYDFTLLLDGDKVARQYAIIGTPGVIIVDQDMNIRFDLRELPAPPFVVDNKASNRSKAARVTPYWAAEIRKALDRLD